MKDYLQSIKFFEQYNEDVNKFSLLCVRLLETQEWKALSLIIKEKAGVLVSQANDKNKLNGVEFFTISLDEWQQGATITDDLKTMNTIFQIRDVEGQEKERVDVIPLFDYRDNSKAMFLHHMKKLDNYVPY